MIASARSRGLAGACLVAAAGLSLSVAATPEPTGEPSRAALIQQPAGATGKASPPRAAQPADDESLVLHGRVLDPDGQPVAGAQLLLNVPTEEPGERRHLGKTGPDGHFTVSIPRTIFEPTILGLPTSVDLAAMASGFGPDWSPIDPGKLDGPITLKLRRDDVPIEGRVTSPEGRPIPGVSVGVYSLDEIPPEAFGKLRANAGKVEPRNVPQMDQELFPPDEGELRPVKTDADGRFRLTGVGRDRVVKLRLGGSGIETSLKVVTSLAGPDDKPVRLPGGSDKLKHEARRYAIVVRWGQAIEGTVRDRDTGKPIAGARLATSEIGGNDASGTSDAQGRYRLEGMTRGSRCLLTVGVGNRPYISVSRLIEAQAGPDPIRLDVALKRGVWVEGRVAKASNGKPVKATIYYYPARDNPNVKECPDAPFLQARRPGNLLIETDGDGRFRTAVVPGRGIIVVQTSAAGYVVVNPVDAKMAREFLYLLDSPPTLIAQALLPIDVPADKSLTLPESRLREGPVQHIRLTDADGRPVAGARVATLNLQWFIEVEQPFPADEVTYKNVNPGKAETLLFIHEDHRIGGVVVLKGDEPDPVQVVLRPCGTVTGRLVDENGKPGAGMMIQTLANAVSRGRPAQPNRFDSVTTGPDGRFRIEHLVPEVSYTTRVIEKDEATGSVAIAGYLHQEAWTVKQGEVQEWGNVKATGP